MTTRLPHEIRTLELGTPTASIADRKLASASYHHSHSSPIYSTATRTQAKASALQQPLVSETDRGLFWARPFGPTAIFLVQLCAWKRRQMCSAGNQTAATSGRGCRCGFRKSGGNKNRPARDQSARYGCPLARLLALCPRESKEGRGETLTDEPQQRSSFNPGHQTARLGRRFYQRRPVPSPAARDVGRGRLKGGQRTGADGNDRRACRHGIANRSLEIRRLPLAWPYFLASDTWGAPLRHWETKRRRRAGFVRIRRSVWCK